MLKKKNPNVSQYVWNKMQPHHVQISTDQNIGIEALRWKMNGRGNQTVHGGRSWERAKSQVEANKNKIICAKSHKQRETSSFTHLQLVGLSVYNWPVSY